MTRLTYAAAAAALAMAVAACGTQADETAAAASSSIAGTWKANLDSAQFENDVNTYLLADGQFNCESCLPPYSVTANGEWQSVERPGMDGQMIEVVDANTLKSSARFGEKDIGNSTWTVSEDGQSMTIAWNDLDGEEEVSGSTTYARSEAGPEGAHAVSGSWTVSELGEMSDAGLTFGFAIDGDQYTSTGNGSTFTATLGGEAVGIEGNNAGTMVAVEQTGASSYKETYTRDGEVIGVTELSVDGDTLSGVGSDPRDDSVVRWTATRQ